MTAPGRPAVLDIIGVLKFELEVMGGITDDGVIAPAVPKTLALFFGGCKGVCAAPNEVGGT